MRALGVGNGLNVAVEYGYSCATSDKNDDDNDSRVLIPSRDLATTEVLELGSSGVVRAPPNASAGIRDSRRRRKGYAPPSRGGGDGGSGRGGRRVSRKGIFESSDFGGKREERGGFGPADELQHLVRNGGSEMDGS